MKKQAPEGRIFLSYRREDSSGYAGRLFDHLKKHFGKDRVFMDISNIEPGTDFVESIENALRSCDAFLVLIGNNWLDCRDGKGQRRLDDPEDFIRLETSTALKRNVRVFPVLVKGAEMPSGKELPEDMGALARRNAHELSDSRWEYDCQQLMKILETIVGPAEEAAGGPAPMPPAEAQKKNLKAIFSLVLAGLVAVSLVTEGIADEDTLIGAVALTIGALVLGVVALYDVKMKKSGGRALAIGSIICSVLVGLLLVGQLPAKPVATRSPQSEPLLPDQPEPSSTANPPVTAAQPSRPDSPPAAASPSYPQVSGSWQGSDGMSYQIEQSGPQIRIIGLNPFGVQIMTGQGQFEGSAELQFDYSLSDGSYGEARFRVVEDGQRLNGHFTNHATGRYGQISLTRGRY